MPTFNPLALRKRRYLPINSSALPSNRIFTQAMKPPCYLLTSYQIRGVILLSGTQPCLEWCLNGPKIPILPSTLMMPLETVMDKTSFKHAWYNNQFAFIPVQTIYEPKYINGKAHRYGIHREDNEPFTVAGLYEMVKIGDQLIRSMTMLTINADQHPFMSQFHKPEDEKRSIVVIEPQHRTDWLNMTHENAFELLLPMGEGYTAEYRPKPSKTHDSAPNEDLLDLLLPKS